MERVVRWQWFMLKLAIILMLVFAALFTVGCSGDSDAHENDDALFRLTVRNMDNDSHGIPTYTITDTETGCQYLVVRVYEGAGVTLLVDKYGYPLLADGYSRTEVSPSADGE